MNPATERPKYWAFEQLGYTKHSLIACSQNWPIVKMIFVFWGLQISAENSFAKHKRKAESNFSAKKVHFKTQKKSFMPLIQSSGHQFLDVVGSSIRQKREKIGWQVKSKKWFHDSHFQSLPFDCLSELWHFSVTLVPRDPGSNLPQRNDYAGTSHFTSKLQLRLRAKYEITDLTNSLFIIF